MACRFAHSTNGVPRTLSHLEGLLTTDLPLVYDASSGTFNCNEPSSQQIDAIMGSIETAYKELVAEYEEYEKEEGFQWPP